jgi:hypothetical protein
MDIYGIVSRNPSSHNAPTIPNSFQYENIEYHEKSIKSKNYQLVMRNREDSEQIYEDDDFLVVLLGVISIGYEKIDVKRFVKLYDVKGDYVFECIKGIFNLVIIEKSSVRVRIVSDHFGLVPVFYHVSHGKLVFSTKLDFVRLHAGNGSCNLEYNAILEQIYFNYTLGGKTYYKSIYMQNAASILEFSFGDHTVKKKEIIYWHIANVFGELEKPYGKALSEYSQEFCRIVNSAVDNAKSPILALTGGYDTRTSLAALLGQASNIRCFSYGIKGSPDISIPLLMKKKLGIDYFPLYLDGMFVEEFDNIARSAIFHSDGLADLEKSNNEYAYRSLSLRHSDVVVGIFGSEFLKYYSFPNRLVSSNILRYFTSSEDCQSDCDSHCFDYGTLRAFHQCAGSYIRENYLNKYPDLSTAHKVLLFYYYEGVRKYFMKELRIARYYANIIAPFIDKDLLEILFRSRLPNIRHLQRWDKSLLQKHRAHFVYSHIIRKYYPQLLDVTTDRGYKPKYDLFMWSRLFIIPYYIRYKLKKRERNYLYNIWARPFVEKYSSILRTSDLLKPLFPNNDERITFSDEGILHRLLSVAVYLNGISW